MCPFWQLLASEQFLAGGGYQRNTRVNNPSRTLLYQQRKGKNNIQSSRTRRFESELF